MDQQPAAPSVRRSLLALGAARLVVTTLYRFVYPFLPAIARGLGVSLQQAGALVSIRNVSAIGLPLSVRALGRGTRHRRQVSVALAVVALGAFLVVGPGGFALAVVGFVLMGVAKPTYDIGAQTYLADRTPYDRRARVMGLLELTFAGGLLVGGPVVGLLTDAFGWRAGFVTTGVLALLAIPVVRASMEPGQPAGTLPDQRLRLDGPRVAFLVATLVFMVGTEMAFVTSGAWMEDDLAMGLVMLGWMAFVLGAAEVAGEVVVIVAGDRLGKRRAMAGGLAIGAVGFGMVATVGTTALTGVASLSLALFGFELGIVAAIPYASELAPRARGPFMAWFGVALMLGRAIGALVGPWLYVRQGMDAVAMGSAATFVVAIGLLLAGAPDDRRPVRHPAPLP